MYRDAIHSAVVVSGSCDAYTGEKLDWSLISQFDNDVAHEHGREYKHCLAWLPTVDHMDDGTGPANFKICGWATNDAKNDLELPAFLDLCRVVLEHHGYTVTKPG
jgi:hypothetical protein